MCWVPGQTLQEIADLKIASLRTFMTAEQEILSLKRLREQKI